jgi:hypothetical protein
MGKRPCHLLTRMPIQRESESIVNSQRAYCKIVLAGPLTEHWADYLGDLLADMEVEKGEIQISTLMGRPYDLAAYIGMLNVLSNLGYTVITTEYWQGSASKAAVTDSAGPVHT